ncbi:MAG: hypothetical protein AB7V27_10160 [Candidatus Binatia bacterium]
MARVWFVRRRGGLWVAPGGDPAFERPFAELIFPLCLGTHRRLFNDVPTPSPDEPPAPPSELQRVFIEVGDSDLDGLKFTAYQPGYYDSPYSPAEVARRLGGPRAARPAAA